MSRPNLSLASYVQIPCVQPRSSPLGFAPSFRNWISRYLLTTEYRRKILNSLNKTDRIPNQLNSGRKATETETTAAMAKYLQQAIAAKATVHKLFFNKIHQKKIQNKIHKTLLQSNSSSAIVQQSLSATIQSQYPPILFNKLAKLLLKSIKVY